MGFLEKIRKKVSDHHANAKIDRHHNSGNDQSKPVHKNWIAKGQGGDRVGEDEHRPRAGSLTNPDVIPAIADPVLHAQIMANKNRAGSTSE